MVNVSIDVTDLGGEARPGDKVVFWRPRMGGSATHAGRVISTAPVTVFLTDGKATVSDVEPGEMTVLLQCRGVESQGPVTVGVPDGDHTVTLRALLESQFEYAPPIVSAVQEAASNASASERAAIEAQVRSEAAADRAEDRVDDAINNGANLVRNEVKQDADRAVSARQAAVQSESNAAASENAAASSASNAAASESAAKQSETNAGDYAAVATTAATEAVDAMEVASEAASSIGDSVTEAAQHATSAAQFESGAAVHAQNASDAADRAGTAEQIGTWTQQVQDAADRIGTAATVEGWVTSAQNYAAAALESESNAASSKSAAKQSEERAEASAIRGEYAASQSLAVVYHGENATFPRPDTDRPVLWLGSVVPYNIRAGDLVPEVSVEPQPWSPEMLDLVAWYDPTAGQQPEQIIDRGPHELHMTVGGTGGITLNDTALGQPAFANGGTAFATSPALPAGTWQHPVTVFMVVSLASMNTVSTLLDQGPGPIATRVAFWVNSGGRVALMQGTTLQSEPYLVTQDTPFVLAVTFTGGANSKAELNGTVVAGPGNAGANTLGSIRLFANGAAANLSNAAIGDVIIAQDVTPEQHTDVVAWLREKWGL